MATPLDLQEQEQLDSIKHFWKQYGNLITWVLIIALGGFAAFNGWQWMQRDRAVKASVLFDELDKAVTAGDTDKVARVLADMKERYGSTAFAGQAGLLAAKAQFEKGQNDAARASLEWVIGNASEKEYAVLARLRLAGVLLDEKKYDEALKALPTDPPTSFSGLVADRRGDILTAQGKADEARAAYQVAFDAMAPTLDYRRLVEAKLTALGAAPETPATVVTVPAAAGASK
ncbi:MAG: tetratricopeptide repeat protein [Methylibium sp.]|jgi:predicted negative regulator of RcsB-dependent stress response|uniref:YfgM family protein n=1 Tax=Methylibium sp. TaxID=2067992 RepID=UPI00274DE330|nr:tetratricopeptide repeat protein [Methylibium sp.]